MHIWWSLKQIANYPRISSHHLLPASGETEAQKERGQAGPWLCCKRKYKGKKQPCNYVACMGPWWAAHFVAWASCPFKIKGSKWHLLARTCRSLATQRHFSVGATQYKRGTLRTPRPSVAVDSMDVLWGTHSAKVCRVSSCSPCSFRLSSQSELEMRWMDISDISISTSSASSAWHQKKLLFFVNFCHDAVSTITASRTEMTMKIKKNKLCCCCCSDSSVSSCSCCWWCWPRSALSIAVQPAILLLYSMSVASPYRLVCPSLWDKYIIYKCN